MIQFHWPWLIICLPLPGLLRHYLPVAQIIGNSVLRVPFMEEIPLATESNRRSSNALITWRRVCWLLWCLVVIAAMRPQWFGAPIPLQLSGRDIMLAVDLSGSMGEMDFELSGEQVDRLAVVKYAAQDFIKERKTDRIGLILFGEQPYLQTPLTHDHITVNRMLNESLVGLAGDGTAIGDAIGLAIKRLQERPKNQRILILLTDGRNTAGELPPERAAELAKQRHLKIYTIGLGSEARVVQNWFMRRVVNPSRELDEETLKKVADMTGGAYFRATDLDSLREIYHKLNELEPIDTDQRYYRPTTELYIWPLGLALILSFLVCAWVLWLRALPARYNPLLNVWAQKK